MRNKATASLPMKPTTEATATAHSIPIGCGSMIRSTAWYPATTALKRMISTMITPARSSTLPYPNVKRLLTPRRVRAKAIPRGTAVAASPKLWMVSESKATLPDISTTVSCKRAVAMRPTNDHLMAQIPRSEVAMAGSTAPWVWPCSPCPGWSCKCSSLWSRVTGAILPRPGLFTGVRGRIVLRSWTSALRRSEKFGEAGFSELRLEGFCEVRAVMLTGVQRRGGISWLVAPGLAVIAVTYGLARFAYGLFLPEMRETLDLSETALGLIGAGSYAGYCLAVLGALLFTSRSGPRLMAVAAGTVAVVGRPAVAGAPAAWVLALGVLVAGSSSGLASPPMGEAVATAIPEESQD